MQSPFKLWIVSGLHLAPARTSSFHCLQLSVNSRDFSGAKCLGSDLPSVMGRKLDLKCTEKTIWEASGTGTADVLKVWTN